jgi:hypothetical protein
MPSQFVCIIPPESKTSVDPLSLYIRARKGHNIVWHRIVEQTALVIKFADIPVEPFRSAFTAHPFEKLRDLKVHVTFTLSLV